MEMYTELNIGVNLRKDTPVAIIETLQHMLRSDDTFVPSVEHPLFKTERWSWMLNMDSYYFDGFSHSAMQQERINNE